MFDILFSSENSISEETDSVCGNIPIFSGFVVACGKIVEIYRGVA